MSVVVEFIYTSDGGSLSIDDSEVLSLTHGS